MLKVAGLPSILVVVSERGGGTTVVIVGGELDIASVPDLRVRLNEAVHDAVLAGEPRVELEIDGLTFCDASGVRLLVDTAAQARLAGCELVVRNPRGPVRRIFDIAQLGDALAISYDESP